MKHDIQITAKTNDYERYLCSLFVDANARQQICLSIVFAAEVMRIPAIISDEMVGLVRLKWWCEQLQQIIDSATSPSPSTPTPSTPILQELQQYPALIAHYIELCEVIADNLPASLKGVDLSAIKQVMRAYFTVLAHAAGEAQTVAQYHDIADLCSEIAMIRTNPYADNHHADTPQISYKLASYKLGEHTQAITRQTPYLQKLERIVLLWQKQLYSGGELRKNPNEIKIKHLALKLCTPLFTFSLPK